MTITNLDKIKEEIIVFLRNNIADPKSRGVAGSDIFIAGGASGNFTLSQLGVKNITNATVAGSLNKAYFDYTPNYQNTSPSSYPIVTFITVPASGQQVIINYRYGETWLYPDYPRLDLSLDSYPRLSCDIISDRTEPFGIGGTAVSDEFLFTVTAFADRTDTVDNLLSQVKSGLILNMKNFYHLPYMQPVALGPMGKEEGRNERISIRNLDFTGKFKVEQI